MILGMMRIKNESRWIERVLLSMLPVCERIFILDDHSTDDTVAKCEAFEKVTVFASPFSGIDETRDKNWLLERIEAEAVADDWILAIDGDEELDGSASQIPALTERGSGPDAYRFQVLYLWDRPDQIRVDRLYSNFFRPSLFRLTPGRRFRSVAGGGFHCGNVPEPRQIGDCGVRLLHYGYMHKEDRIRKYEWYNAPDKQPVPAVEDGYRHMVVGDIFPADSSFRWAGPLELRAL